MFRFLTDFLARIPPGKFGLSNSHQINAAVLYVEIVIVGYLQLVSISMSKSDQEFKYEVSGVYSFFLRSNCQ